MTPREAREAHGLVVHALACTPRFVDIPDAVSASPWVAKRAHIILAVSPSAGALADWLVNEDGSPPLLDAPAWMALAPQAAWFATYMDALMNRPRPSHPHP